MKKPRTHSTFRLSREGRKLLAGLARADGITMTAVVEQLIRHAARLHNLRFRREVVRRVLAAVAKRPKGRPRGKANEVTS